MPAYQNQPLSCVMRAHATPRIVHRRARREFPTRTRPRTETSRTRIGRARLAWRADRRAVRAPPPDPRRRARRVATWRLMPAGRALHMARPTAGSAKNSACCFMMMATPIRNAGHDEHPGAFGAEGHMQHEEARDRRQQHEVRGVRKDAHRPSIEREQRKRAGADAGRQVADQPPAQRKQHAHGQPGSSTASRSECPAAVWPNTAIIAAYA